MRFIPLTLDNCPDFIGAFRAASWHEAVEKFQYFLLIEKKQSAVWLRDRLPLSEIFNENMEAKEFCRQANYPAKNINYPTEDGQKEVDLGEFYSGRNEVILHLNPDELKALEVLSECNPSYFRIIKRHQVKLPAVEKNVHLDMYSAMLSLRSYARAPDRDKPFGNCRTRFLISNDQIDSQGHDNDGLGPIIYKKPSDILSLLNQNGYVRDWDGLEEGFQIPGNSVTSILGYENWADQATLHSPPGITRQSHNPRRLTVIDLVF